MKKVYWKVAFAILVGCVQSVLSLGCAWLLKMAVDIVTGADNDGGFSTFCLIATVYYVVYLLVFWLGKRIHISAAKSLRTKVKERLFPGLLWASQESHQSRQAGQVLSKFQYQVDLLEKAYYEPMVSLIKNIVLLAVSLGAALFLQWQIALGIVVFFALYLFFTRGVNKKLESLQSRSAEAKALEDSEIITMVKGFYVARDCGQEEYFLSRYGKRVQDSAKASFACNFSYDVLSVISTNLETVITLLVICAGGVILESGSFGITAGSILGMTQLVVSVIGPVGSMGTMVAGIKSTKKVRQDLTAFEKEGLAGKAEWTEKQEPLPKLQDISLQDISFSYGDKPVLQNVSLTFAAGKKYAVIGESGSGKTTLLKLILKQMKPDAGRICRNGIPYEEIGASQLLYNIGYVGQEPMIFHKNIRENIVAGSSFRTQADAEKMDNVFRQSGLGIMRAGMSKEEILSVPASELSGGEKKRVAYARALYKDCEVLVIDEVTSALHEEMALALEDELLKQSQKLIIHVTHCLSEERKPFYDGIFEVGNGTVTALIS